MNTPPASAIRWGTAVVGILILMLLFISWLVRYPYIVRADAIITTEKPPANIVARLSGDIEHLLVSDGQTVRQGAILGVLETTASYRSVQRLGSLLDTISLSDIKLAGDRFFRHLPDNPDLGGIQDRYSSFRKSCFNYLNHIEIDYYGKKIKAVREEIKSIEDYIGNLKSKKELISSRLELEEKKYLRDSLLNKQELLPDALFEDSKQKYYSLKIEVVQVVLEAASRRIDLASKKQTLQDLFSAGEEERQKYRSVLEDNLIRLKAGFDGWKQNHLLISPVDGNVTFTRYWAENQSVREGETVMTVVPEGQKEIIARMNIPMTGSGRVREGQTVNIQLKGYPYLEYGMVRGVIHKRSLVPHENMYVLDVKLPGGLSTFYGKRLEFSHNMEGRAEIITEDIRLIERALYPFKYLLEKNRDLSEAY